MDVMGRGWGVLGWLWAHLGSLSLPWKLHLAAFGGQGRPKGGQGEAKGGRREAKERPREAKGRPRGGQGGQREAKEAKGSQNEARERPREARPGKEAKPTKKLIFWHPFLSGICKEKGSKSQPKSKRRFLDFERLA